MLNAFFGNEGHQQQGFGMQGIVRAIGLPLQYFQCSFECGGTVLELSFRFVYRARVHAHAYQGQKIAQTLQVICIV
ncbi:Uncharacterised protein [Burkholderia pseudomallei]|nr:Uncharacterised protein [Burkholderia pseudomallei]VBT48688.1 Uncharacterised protein [Burkholderia pseudomallei]